MNAQPKIVQRCNEQESANILLSSLHFCAPSHKSNQVNCEDKCVEKAERPKKLQVNEKHTRKMKMVFRIKTYNYISISSCWKISINIKSLAFTNDFYALPRRVIAVHKVEIPKSSQIRGNELPFINKRVAGGRIHAAYPFKGRIRKDAKLSRKIKKRLVRLLGRVRAKCCSVWS